MSDDTNISLPGLLDDIASVTSVRAALQVAAAKGGQLAYIPAKFKNGEKWLVEKDHWLVLAVGLDDAEKIAELLAGGSVGGQHLIPMAVHIDRSSKWKQIQKLVDEGLSADKIARATGVHRRTVFRRQKKNPTFPLFDD